MKINKAIVLDRSLLSQPKLPTCDPFSSIFPTRREKENEINTLVKRWVSEYKGKARIGVRIQQLGVVADLVFRSNGKEIAVEIMRYLCGVRGSWVIAKLRSLGALTTPMELQRYGLVARGGILLAHYGKREVISIANDISETAIRVRESSCYFQESLPIVALVDLEQKKLELHDFSQRNWLAREFSLFGLSSLRLHG